MTVLLDIHNKKSVVGTWGSTTCSYTSVGEHLKFMDEIKKKTYPSIIRV